MHDCRHAEPDINQSELPRFYRREKRNQGAGERYSDCEGFPPSAPVNGMKRQRERKPGSGLGRQLQYELYFLRRENESLRSTKQELARLRASIADKIFALSSKT